VRDKLLRFELSETFGKFLVRAQELAQLQRMECELRGANSR
jgi:hypothetical protein